MAITTKKLSSKNGDTALRSAFNTEDASITTNGFLAGKIGRKVEFSYTTTSVSNDTVVVTMKEDSNIIMVYKMIYTDGTRNDLISCERIS